jgi:two-component system KDP operon response regulator KdpE
MVRALPVFFFRLGGKSRKGASLAGANYCWLILQASPAKIMLAEEMNIVIGAPAEQAGAGRVLVVNGDYELRRALHLTLYSEGFDVVGEASSVEEAIGLVHAIRCDVAVLDVNISVMDGVEACRKLRPKYPSLAILMLTARGGHEDGIAALEAGADDYIAKPFHVRELTARIRAAVRRIRTPKAQIADALKIGNIVLDTERRSLQKAGQTIHVSPKEFEVLEHLMRHSGRPLSHTRLLSLIWGPEHATHVEYLRTIIRQLRKKLEDDPAAPKYLLTHTGLGYWFNDGSKEVADRLPDPGDTEII